MNELEDEVKHLKKSVQKLEKANEDQKLIQQKETNSFLNATTNILKMNAKGKIFLEKNNIRQFFSNTIIVYYFQVFIAVKTITTKVSIAQDTTTCIQEELQLWNIIFVTLNPSNTQLATTISNLVSMILDLTTYIWMEKHTGYTATFLLVK